MSRRITSVFLVLVIVLCSCIPVSAAARQDSAESGGLDSGPGILYDGYCISADAVPDRETYEAGDVMELTVRISNTGYFETGRFFVYAKYSGEACLVPGNVADTCASLSAGGSEEFGFSLKPYDSKLKSGTSPEAAPSFAGRFICFFSALFKYIRGVFTFETTAAGSRKKVASVNVVYAGKDVSIDIFVIMKNMNRVKKEFCLSDASVTGGARITGQISSVFIPSAFLFSASPENDDFTGYALCLDARNKTVSLLRRENGMFALTAKKTAAVTAGVYYGFDVRYTNDRLKVYFLDNEKDEDPYPFFDIPFEPCGNAFGCTGSVKDIKAEAYTAPAEEAKTYCNPVFPLSPDPYIYEEDGVYYLYATNYAWQGYKVSTSSDLVNWSEPVVCADKEDIYGDSNFWAPEVYKHNGRYYLFYSADEKLAVACADSPLGPFVKTKDSYLTGEEYGIDSHVFFDDDGSIYMYYAGGGIKVCRLADDLTSVVPGTTKLIINSDKYGWAEGPYMLKHNGMYYLTYSGNDYVRTDYRVMVSVSDSPVSGFGKEKPGENVILSPDSVMKGTGHHCFAYSPDKTEMFIVYHCHYSDTAADPRPLCLDRVKFVPSACGADRLAVYGPTGTPQPVPSGAE